MLQRLMQLSRSRSQSRASQPPLDDDMDNENSDSDDDNRGHRRNRANLDNMTQQLHHDATKTIRRGMRRGDGNNVPPIGGSISPGAQHRLVNERFLVTTYPGL